MAIPTITPFLWFDHQAEEAATFYTSVFPDSRVRRVVRYGATGPGPAGSVMTVEFELAGQVFVTLNGVQDLTPEQMQKGMEEAFARSG